MEPTKSNTDIGSAGVAAPWAVFTAEMPENTENVLEIEIPVDAVVLNFGLVDEKLIIWLLATTNKEPVMRMAKFFLMKDGSMACEDNIKKAQYIGSVVRETIGWHCFQL